MISEKTFRKTAETTDPFPLLGIDYLEFYVGNARQAAYYYQSAFGFQPLAYRGLETGDRDTESYAVAQGNIRFVFTSPLHSQSEIGRHLDRHGDGVRVCALTVEDATGAYQTAVGKGAHSFYEPRIEKDEQGKVTRSAIRIYGDTIHVFVERKHYPGVFLPGYRAWYSDYQPPETGLESVDHLVANVEQGKMNEWVRFYREVLGFKQIISFDDKDISTDYTALMSKVMSHGNGRIKFPVNEPAPGLKKSQIEEYLEFYEGPGVQHIALITPDIIRTVKSLKNRGVEFLTVPPVYYDNLEKRVGPIDETIGTLKELGILADRDDEGYLLQIFTKPVNPRPTLFFEIIQRKGATSFGKGNFKALFEAIEREQERRGTL